MYSSLLSKFGYFLLLSIVANAAFIAVSDSVAIKLEKVER